jgi:hypothetical protein
MVQTIFFLLVGVLLIIGAWQAAPDSALRQWEASRKEKEAAISTRGTTGICHTGGLLLKDQNLIS